MLVTTNRRATTRHSTRHAVGHKIRLKANSQKNRYIFGPNWSYLDKFPTLLLPTLTHRTIYICQPNLENTRISLPPCDVFPRDRFIRIRIFCDALSIHGLPPTRIFVEGDGIIGCSKLDIPARFAHLRGDCHLRLELIETSTINVKQPCRSCREKDIGDKHVFGIIKPHPFQPLPFKRLNGSHLRYFEFDFSFRCTSLCYTDPQSYTSMMFRFTLNDDTFTPPRTLEIVSSPFIVIKEPSRNPKLSHKNMVVFKPPTADFRDY